MGLPEDIRRLFGFALSLALAGDKHDAAKVLRGFGGAGVLEVVEDDAGGTYRAVYTVKFAQAVFVLYCFQQKSKRGVATPTEVANCRRIGSSTSNALSEIVFVERGSAKLQAENAALLERIARLEHSIAASARQ